MKVVLKYFFLFFIACATIISQKTYACGGGLSHVTTQQVDIGLTVQTCTATEMMTVICDCAGRKVNARFASKVASLLAREKVRFFLLKNACVTDFNAGVTNGDFLGHILSNCSHITGLKFTMCTGLASATFASPFLMTLELPGSDVSITSILGVCELCTGLKHLNITGCFTSEEDKAVLARDRLMIVSDSLLSCCVDDDRRISVICPKMTLLYRGGVQVSMRSEAAEA